MRNMNKKDADISHGSGGYVSTSHCTSCNGTANDYSCYCYAPDVWAWASIDLSRFIHPLPMQWQLSF